MLYRCGDLFVVKFEVCSSFVALTPKGSRQCGPRRRQSTRVFLQSSELGPPPPSPADECVPPGTKRGGGGPNSDERAPATSGTPNNSREAQKH
jgi:hypothetical protein